MAEDPYFFVFGLLSLFIILSRRWGNVGREASLALLLSAAAGTAIMAYALGGLDVYRYTFPFVCVAIIILMTELLAHSGLVHQGQTQRAYRLMAVLAAGMLIGTYWNNSGQMYFGLIENIRLELHGEPLISVREIDQHIRMQQSIPEGATVLTRLEKPFLLNFRRNQIFIADWPGGASLPPGMPAFKGSEALADYFVSKSIRYIAYSHASEAAFSKETFARRAKPNQHPWVKTAAQNAFDFQDNLQDLGRTRKHIYDDGEIFVLDLVAQDH
jgi:hypothetical protein